MLSREQTLEHELVCYFKLLADGEKKIEISRQVLCKQENFEVYTCFRVIDKDRKGYISSFDIVTFLR